MPLSDLIMLHPSIVIQSPESSLRAQKCPKWLLMAHSHLTRDTAAHVLVFLLSRGNCVGSPQTNTGTLYKQETNYSNVTAKWYNKLFCCQYGHCSKVSAFNLISHYYIHKTIFVQQILNKHIKSPTLIIFITREAQIYKFCLIYL